MYDKFICSDIYTQCDLHMRNKLLTLKNMKNFFENNKISISSFKKIFDKRFDGKRIKLSNVLIGYIFK